MDLMIRLVAMKARVVKRAFVIYLVVLKKREMRSVALIERDKLMEMLKDLKSKPIWNNAAPAPAPLPKAALK